MQICSECSGSGIVWDYETVEYELCNGEYEYDQEEFEKSCHICDGEGTVFKEK